MVNQNIKGLAKDVDTINIQMGRINQDLANVVKNEDKDKFRKVKTQIFLVKKALRDVKNFKPTLPDKPDTVKDYSLSHMWGDPRNSPYWLKLAEYFGIKEKEFPIASSKLNRILDWAANESKSRKMSDILATVGKTVRKLQSPGYSERVYAILYRYIKLAEEKKNVSPEVQKDIEKEMTAYTK